MKRILMGLGCAAGVLIFAAPRAAQAVAAVLVQVTNTAANPAITQDISRQAGQSVDLSCALTPASQFVSYINACSSVSPSSLFVPNYAVPANQSLVVTGVDITQYCGGTQAFTYILSVNGSTTRKAWSVTGLNTASFTYPTGFVLGPGLSPTFLNPGCSATVDMHGYLTGN
jgi:hypothetical protein